MRPGRRCFGLLAQAGALYTAPMPRFWRMLLLWLALVGVPLQAVSAAAMVLCEHGYPHAPVMTGDSHAGHSDSQPGGDQAGLQGDPCTDCGECHLCSAHALPGVTTMPAGVAASVPIARPSPQPDGFLPDQPKRPPLA